VTGGVLAGRFDPGARLSAPGPEPAPADVGSRSPPLAPLLTFGVGAAMLLVVASVSWLRVVAALATLGAIALALPMLLMQRQPGEWEDGGD
jgi:hypothetical protein